MPTKFTGGCACGTIRYEIAAEPMLAAHCRCRDCQRATGTGHSSFMLFAESAMRMTGKPKYRDGKALSGNTVSRGFCPDCGSPLIARSSGYPGTITVAPGSLDDPSRFKPQMVLFAASGQPWDHHDPALPSFAAAPSADKTGGS